MASKFLISYSDRFLRNFAKLDSKSQQAIREAIEQLTDDPRHPGLRTHRVRATKSVWEASDNMDLRITWQYSGSDVIVVRNCGHHDRTLKNP